MMRQASDLPWLFVAFGWTQKNPPTPGKPAFFATYFLPPAHSAYHDEARGSAEGTATCTQPCRD